MPDAPLQQGITRPASTGLSSLLFNQAPSAQVNQSAAAAAVADSLRFMNMNNSRYAPEPIYSPLKSALRYDDTVLGFNPERADQEDIYARNQGIISSTANGLGRFATTALTKMGAGFGYVGAAIINSVEGNEGVNFEQRLNSWMARTADNAFTGFFNNLEDDIKNDWMPIYQEAADRDKGFWSRALTDLNFWTEDFSDGAAFMASAMVPGMLISKLGLGVRAVRGLNALGLGRRIEQTAETAKAFTEGLKTATSLTNNYEAISAVPRVAKWISNAKLARNIDVATQTILSTTSEAMFEASEVKQHVIQSLENKINPETGIEYTGRELNELGAKAAMGTFQGNLLALSLSNLWEANLIFKRLPSTAAAAGNKVKFAEGLTGAAEYVKPNYLKVFGKKAAEGVLAEGLWEENIQLAISRFNEAKYAPTAKNKKYSSSVLDNYMTQTVEGISGEDKEAAISIGLGAILGGIVGGTLSTKQDRAEDKVLSGNVAQYNSIANSFKGLKDIYEYEDITVKDAAGNDVTSRQLKRGEDGNPVLNQKKLEEFQAGVIERTHLLELMNNAKDSKDQSLANMYENEMFSQFAMAHFEMGNADALFEKLDNLQNIKDEDLNILGYDSTNKEQAFQKLSELKLKAKNLQNLYDDIQANVLENTKDGQVTNFRKQKLFALGARQMFLVEEIKKSQGRTIKANDSLSNHTTANQFIANEKALEKRVEGLKVISESIGEIEEDVINDAEEDLAKAKQQREEYLAQNKDLFKGMKTNANGYLYDPEDPTRNTLADDKQHQEMENLAGLNLALKETTNRFNKLADIRKGDKYTTSFIIQERLDIPEKYADINESEVDVDNLNNKLRVLLQNVRFDPLSKEFPYLVDASMPLVARLKIIQKLADEGEPLAKEILDEFAPEVDKALQLAEQMRKIREDKERQDEIDKEAEKNLSENPGENNQDTSPELAKKDITQIASTAVVRDGETTEHDNYHLRHEAYLSNLASKRYKGDKVRTKVLLVNEANEEKYGLKDLIVFKGTTDADKILLLVHVEQDADGKLHYVDVNGERLAEVGQPVDYKKLVYGQMSSDNLNVANTEDARYRNESGVDEKQVQAWWVKTRGELLKVTDPTIYDFNISAGRINPDLMGEVSPGVYPRLNLTESTLVSEDEFNEPIIEVATDKTTALKNTNGIAPETAAPKTSKGTVYLNKDGVIIPLKNSQFSEEEVDRIYSILLHLSKELYPTDNENRRSAEEIFNDSPMQFLKSLLYFSQRPAAGEEIGSSRMWIQKGLGFKNPRTGQIENINMVPLAIEAKEALIKEFLRSAYHQVDKKVLNEQNKFAPKSAERKFIEVGIDADGKPYIVREWESYNHYLLSTKNPDGSAREPKLKIEMKKPSAGQTVIVNRYIKPVGDPFKLSVTPVAKPEKATPKKGKSSPAKTETKVSGGKAIVEYTSNINGQAIPMKFEVAIKPEGEAYTAEDLTIVDAAEEVVMAYMEFLITKDADQFDGLVASVRKENPKLDEEMASRLIARSTFLRALANNINKGKILVPGRGAKTDETTQEEVKEELKEVPKEEAKTKPVDDVIENEEDINEEALRKLMEEDDDSGESATRLLTQAALDRAYNSNYKVGNIDAEEAWFKKRFPQIPFERVKDLIHLTSGARAWGVLEGGMVKIYENAEEGTTFHEGFEVVWNLMLSGKEQFELFTDFTKRSGSFVTYKGVSKSYAQASIKEAKEHMAEEMREWVLTGKKPVTKSHANFFARIWDWIVSLLKGKNELIDIFKKIDKGYYAEYPIHYTAETMPAEAREVKDAPEAYVQDVLQEMTVKVFSEVFQEDSSLLESLEGDRNIEASQTMYDKLKAAIDNEIKTELAAHFREKIKGTDNVKLKEQYQKDYLDIVNGNGKNGNAFGWQFVKDNWDSFVKDHKRFLNSFNTKFEMDEEGDIINIDLEDADTDESSENRNEYDRDIFRINAKNAASTYVKMMFATIADSEHTQVWKDIYQREKDLAKMDPYMFQTDVKGKTNHYKIKRENSSIKGAQVAQYAQTFNYILHNVSNSTSITSIFDRMKNMAKDPRIQKNANVYRILSRMKMHMGFNNKTNFQVRGLLKLENALMKQKPEFFEQRYLKNGEVVLNKSNFSTKTKEIAREWVENLKSATFVKVDKANNFLFSDSLPYVKSSSTETLLTFARALGITQLTDEAYQSLSQKDKNEVNSQLAAIRNVIAKNINVPLSFISGKSVGIQARLENIADILMNKVLAEDNESQHANNEGKPTSNFVLNNWVSYVLNIANESFSKESFFNKVKWLNTATGDIFSRDSVLVNEKMYTEDGTRNQSISLAVAEGIKSEQFGNRSLTKMTLEERVMYEFNNNLRGIYNVLIPADAKTEWVINAGTYVPLTLYKQSLQREATKQQYFYDRMGQYLFTEIALAKDYENRKDIINLNLKDSTGREVGKSLRFFKGILDPATVNKIHTEVIDGGKPLQEVVSFEDINKQLQKFLNSKVKKTFDTLSGIGYIKPVVSALTGNKSAVPREYKVVGFLTEVKDAISGKGKTISREALADMIAYREMNYIINNIEMHKVFFGDPAQFADAEKRIKSFMSGRESTHHTVDVDSGFTEWANTNLNEGLQPGDIGYHYFKNHLNSTSVYDVRVSSNDSVIELLSKHIHPSLVDSYRNGNEADAVSWMSPTSYRELLYRAGGRFTNAQEKLFQWHMAYERFVKNKTGQYEYSSSVLYQKDLKTLNAKRLIDAPMSNEVKEELKKSKPKGAIFQVLKPIISGIIFEKGVARTDLVKTATSPLFYEWIENTQLRDMYDVMQEMGIDYIPVQSAHKVGMKTSNTVPLYKDNGTINKEGLRTAAKIQIPFANVGIQVETKGQKEDTTQGSQLNKLDGTDLYKDGVPIDFAPNSKTRIDEWDNLTEDQQLTASPKIHKIYSALTKAKIALVEARYKRTLKKLEITESNGTFKLGEKSKEKVAKFILQELERRQLPINIADAITSGTIDYESIANYKQIRDIIYSIIDKNIVRPKINGAPHVQISVTGWELESRKVNGKNVLVSSRLKFYDLKGGKTQACQILLPNRFRGIPLEKIDKELLKGIGFRIPTQGLNSVEYYEVAGFLPDDMGDVVVFPAEITTKAGSDFDIDKMNLYVKNFYIEDGQAKVINWQGSEEETKEYLRNLVIKGLFLTKADKERAIQYIEDGMSESADQLMNQIFGVDDMITKEDLMELFLDENNLIEEQVDSLYEQTLQNKYLDELMTVISLPENFAKLVSPNTQDLFTDGSPGLKKIAEQINDMKTSEADKASVKRGNLDYERLLDSAYMTQTRHNFIIGKDGVGIGAVSNTNLIINQLSRLLVPLNQAITIVKGVVGTVGSLPFNMNTVISKEEGYASLGGITDASGNINLSNSGSQYIDGYVDIAKGSWIIDMGADSDMAATYLLMNKLGIDPKTYSMFLNQPIILDYVTTRKNQEASIAAGITTRRITNFRRRSDTLRKYQKAKGFTEIAKPNLYNVKEMETIIRKVANGQELTEYEKNLQRFMLDDFLVLEGLKWELYRSVQGYNYDTQKINDKNMHYKKELQTSTALDSKIIIGTANVFNNTFIGSVKTAVDKLNQAFSETLFKLHHGFSRSVLNSIAEEIMLIPRLSLNEYKQLMDRAETTLLNYLIATSNEFKGKSMIDFQKKLMLSETHSVAHYVDALKKHDSLAYKSNTFLHNLIVDPDPREGYPKTVYMRDIAYDAITANNFTDDFRRLLNDETMISLNGKQISVSSIANNLVILGIIQYGTIPTRKSFNKIIPYELYEKYTNNVTEKTGNLVAFRDLDVFYRRNWDNDKLVPQIMKQEITLDTGETVYKFPKKQHLLKLSDHYYLPYRFVKTVEYGKITKNGKQTLDYDNPIVTLYKRVNNADGMPVIEEVNDKVNETTNRYLYYTPAIKWGTASIDEFHTTLTPSIFAENQHVIREQSDFENNKVIFPKKIEELKQQFGIEINMMTEPTEIGRPATIEDELPNWENESDLDENDDKTPFDC